MISLLFQIEFRHDYYSDGRFQDITVTADKDTQTLIDRYQLITRLENSVFSCYATNNSPPGDFLRYLSELYHNKPFIFHLNSSMRDFNIITDLPLDWSGQIILNNDNVVKDEKDNIELKQVLSTRMVHDDNRISVIRLFPGEIFSGNDGNNKYLVKFVSRKTRWQYFVINRSQIKLNQPEITNENNVVFFRRDNALTPTGENALRFDSGDFVFPIRQAPVEQFDLVDSIETSSGENAQRIENVLIKGLPTPKNNQINVAAVKGEQRVYSDVYVYL